MNIATLFLAAGEGTRMKSSTPKVFHKVAGIPIIERILHSTENLSEKKGVVLGKNFDSTEKHFREKYGIDVFHQNERLGTGHAVMISSDFYSDYDGYLMVLPGDTPLLTEETLKHFIEFTLNSKSDCCILGFLAENPFGYGRIIEENHTFIKIVEEKDANEEEKSVKLVNSGIMIVKSSLVSEHISELSNNNSQNEYYLTDLPAILKTCKCSVSVYSTDNEEDFMGVNDRIQLSIADDIANKRNIKHLMAHGVTVYNSSTVRIDSDVEIGKDTIIYPGCIITGKTTIGENCVIKNGAVIHNTLIKDNCEIKPYSVIEESEIANHCTIGPMANLRPGSLLHENVKVGNFVETKKAELKNGVKASHLTYLGDTEIGEDSNIGAGTITCNYDGEKKHKTIIGKNSFIGSDTQLVAPVKIGDYSYVAAGSTITKDVPECSLGISRSKQSVILDWVKRKGKKCPQS